ncbi:alpha-protein kinase 1 isoform X1 [Esox lucius]|uniref:Alpha-type protein kinase domain-containing protein n=1 Tax=Esox lucius TaxID=8010 RepID=A0A3P8YC55_ESOLU|nr:alpha-protein kinase 1 isoform X1 [Esox lucius]XP_034146730.1 alpha-protein kinase 1 isoform X1 [Esox lucius]
MDSQEVAAMLEDCHRAASAAGLAVAESTEEKLNVQKYRESLPGELNSLLQEAVEMRWPFVPEKWQYKQSVASQDKVNLSDFISRHLPQLLALLKVSILTGEPQWAVAVVFLVDRFLYWTDESSRLLKITKLLHRRYPGTPIAPQLIIRQARVYLNDGKLQKAEFILSSLINRSGTTGCWVYHSASDRTLIQAVSVQVRGQVLQKLGLWLEAAELIWASLVGYYALPQPDKKGIGTSLGILANILVSMNDQDFHVFQNNPDFDLRCFLGDSSHRLLSAAEAAKMSLVYSQYVRLYVLTSAVTQGTCLMSYSFSVECPTLEKRSFLLQAKEAFEIGLLTKTDSDMVTSKQELHSFLKAAYSLAVIHKWLGTPKETVDRARLLCRESLEKFYAYCQGDSTKRDALCTEIMSLITRVKNLLRVEPFLNSDQGSFIPDSYREVVEERVVRFTPDGFSRVMERFSQYHASVCEASEAGCRRKCEGPLSGLCITALGTTTEPYTEYATESAKSLKSTHKDDLHRDKASNAAILPSKSPLELEVLTTLGSTEDGQSFSSSKNEAKSLISSLGSSFEKVSLNSSGFFLVSSGNKDWRGQNEDDGKYLCGPDCPTEFSEDGLDSCSERKSMTGERNGLTQAGSHSSLRVAPSSSAHTGSGGEHFEMLDEQSLIETLETDGHGAVTHSGSGTSSFGSLGESFSSQSSSEKLPLYDRDGFRQRQAAVPQICSNGPAPVSEHRGCLSSVSPDAETEDGPESNFMGPDRKAAHQNGPPQLGPRGLIPEPCLSTELESSFEMIEKEVVNNNEPAEEKGQISHQRNPSCYTCLKHGIVGSVVPERQYVLTDQDYTALLAGMCHGCLLKRLQSDRKFKLGKQKSAYSALLLKYSRAAGLWVARETYVYIGEPIGKKGQQRTALWVQFLHQEERLSSYVGKEYLEPKGIQFHLNDVERQMTAQYYVTEFNKRLYKEKVTAQIFFIPSEVLLIMEGDEVVDCVTVEPYMLGDFVKLTNNTTKVDKRFKAWEYGVAFGHFTYQFSGCEEVVVDLQGWVTANGKGLTYLTDPQIHSLRTPKGSTNFAERGIWYFLKDQHGSNCNDICNLLSLDKLQ